jgi:hypothetical protein
MADASTRAPTVAEKSWWGPRIWRILHSLAEINDRTDVGPAWRQALRLTAEILPCAVCRTHFQEHLRGVAFPVGASNYAALRRMLWVAHASTAGASAIPFPEEQLATEYGGSRDEIITRVTDLVSEVVTAFSSQGVLDRLHAASLNPWHRAMGQLIQLLRWPMPPPSAAANQRRRPAAAAPRPQPRRSRRY